MQTILGSNGQIGHELARELYKNYTKNIRLVSRNPKKINPTDQVRPADLSSYEQTLASLNGSDIVYFTVGLPMDTELWENQFEIILQNVIKACKSINSKLVYFDNTYMYPKNDVPQTELTEFRPEGRKSTVRARMANMLLNEIKLGTLNCVICRAPEFYGPNKTQSITNTMLFDNVIQHKRLMVPISKTTKRTLIWTPDASRALALIGNTPSAYQQTWHLPCAPSASYNELINITETITHEKYSVFIVKKWLFQLGATFNSEFRELEELLPRYQYDNIFESTKFQERFPDFEITTYRQGIQSILTAAHNE